MNAIIVDDEPIGRIILEKLLEKFCPHVNIIDSVGSVDVDLINRLKPDVLFLDIHLDPDVTSFELLDKISLNNCAVIFTTACDQYAVKAIKYDALDYLLKPIDPDELLKAVNRLSERRLDERNKSAE